MTADDEDIDSMRSPDREKVVKDEKGIDLTTPIDNEEVVKDEKPIPDEKPVSDNARWLTMEEKKKKLIDDLRAKNEAYWKKRKQR